MKTYSLLFILIAVMAVSCNSVEKKQTETAQLWLTSQDGKHLLQKQEIVINPDNAAKADETIVINDSITYQTMDGFGYTLTGGSAMLMHKMSDTARADLLQELFGRKEENLGVSYIRLSIGASDMDAAPFSYDDLAQGETDVDLAHFNLSQDTLHLIPVLKEILKISPKIKILGSPWSPPVWMKDNGDTRGGSLLEKYYPAYANYFVKYIEVMRDNGIPIDAITIQNEPLHPGNNPSLLMKAPEQGEFIKNHLGPAFAENNLKTKIIIYDHNADRPDYPISILNDPEAAKYIDGSAFHLYGGNVNAISTVHASHPDKNLYFTEQWVGAPGDFAKEMEWHTENLIIGATRNWCKTVLEWNLAADENQQPHTDRGGCDRCLGAITINGDTVTREPAYYIIGQASKFVSPGSIRIESNLTKDLPNVAFKTPEGKTVLILQNKADKAKTIEVIVREKKVLVKLAAKDIATLVL
ncbi:MAG: glycoside hydrolase family 30 beta sandwich domain-containing protein [Leeuwenhoekiella sp.]